MTIADVLIAQRSIVTLVNFKFMTKDNTGFWNEEPITYKVYSYTVTKVENKPHHWQNMVIGMKRQALLVDYHCARFYLDNQHGDAYLKLTVGRGTPMYSHLSVENPAELEELSIEEVRTFNEASKKNEEKVFRKWLRLVDRVEREGLD
jgi:hypothetical protein